MTLQGRIIRDSSDISSFSSYASRRERHGGVTFAGVRSSLTDMSAGRTVLPNRRTPARLSEIHQRYGEEVITALGTFGKSTARMVTDIHGSGDVEPLRRRFEWIIDSTAFHVAIGSCIAASTIQMGLEADFPEQERLWAACEYTITAIFILEAVAKIYVLRMGYITDPWNRFDGLLVVIAVMNLWVLDLIGGAVVPTWVWRLLRLSKLTRTLRLIRTFKRLFLVSVGVWEAMKSTFWVAILLGLAIYAGAILCVGILGPKAEGVERYPGWTDDDEQINMQEIMQEFNPYLSFGNVPRAMLTLFNIAILAEWREVTGPVAKFNPFLIGFFFAFMIFVTFGLMNVLIGLIVNEVIENSQKLAAEEELLERKRKLETIRTIQQLVADIDSDNDGKVSIDDFERSLADNNSPMSVQLGQVDLPLGFSPLELLSMLDSNGDGTLNHDEFVMSFYRLLDGGPFQHSCLVQMGINSLKFGQRVCESRLERIESLILELSEGLRGSGTMRKSVGPRKAAARGTTGNPSDPLGDVSLGKVFDRIQQDRSLWSLDSNFCVRGLSSHDRTGEEYSSEKFRSLSSEMSADVADTADTLLRGNSFQSDISETLSEREVCSKGADAAPRGSRISRISEEEPQGSPPDGWAAKPLDSAGAPTLPGPAAHKAAVRRMTHVARLAQISRQDEAEEAEYKAGLPANSPCLPGLSGTMPLSGDSEPHMAAREWNC